MSTETSNDVRLEKIEVLLSHLQHDVDKLNAALILQQAEIDGLRRALNKLESDVDQIPPMPHDPLDEQPPHY